MTRKKVVAKKRPKIDQAAVAKAAEDALQRKIAKGSADALTRYMKDRKAQDARDTLGTAAEWVDMAVEEINDIARQQAHDLSRFGSVYMSWDTITFPVVFGGASTAISALPAVDVVKSLTDRLARVREEIEAIQSEIRVPA